MGRPRLIGGLGIEKVEDEGECAGMLIELRFEGLMRTIFGSCNSAIPATSICPGLFLRLLGVSLGLIGGTLPAALPTVVEVGSCFDDEAEVTDDR